jgi:hypothetical protein
VVLIEKTSGLCGSQALLAVEKRFGKPVPLVKLVVQASRLLRQPGRLHHKIRQPGRLHHKTQNG